MKARLVAATQPVDDFLNGPEELLAFCARVSSPRDYEERGEGYEGLLNYCMRNKHWSVFEMANIVVEVEAPRDITRQLLRHRSFSFQEFSQRYSSDVKRVQREYRRQDHKNRQNSLDTLSVEETWEASDYETEAGNVAFSAYEDLLSMGVAKECARVVLPEGLTMSCLYVNGTVRSWLHYLDVRDDPGVSQREHVLLVQEIRKAIAPILPTILGANENT
jgi:thymidylate synthase (FAD)